MKVYTHWISLKRSGHQRNEGLRWRTLLQFGNSWNIIGSVVMKNPGASIFKGDKQPVHIPELSKFDSESFEWYEFTNDPTMRAIEGLFAFAAEKPLNGVIQIFNLFYVRDADLGNGIKIDAEKVLPKCLISEDEMLKKDLRFLRQTPKDCPIYLGFSSLAWDKKYGKRAKAFFDETMEHYKNGACYLNTDYKKNPFYHPLYLMGVGRNNPRSKQLRYAFKQETLTPIIPDEEYVSYSLKPSREDISKITSKLLNDSKLEKYDNNKRIIINGFLGLSFEKGKVEIRPIEFLKYWDGRKYNDCQEINDAKSKLENLGYHKTDNVWLGTKAFEEYGNDIDSIIDNIKGDIDSLK